MCVRAHVHAVRREVHFTRNARTRTHALSPSFLRFSVPLCSSQAVRSLFLLYSPYLSLFLRIERIENIYEYTRITKRLLRTYSSSRHVCASLPLSLFLLCPCSSSECMLPSLTRSLAYSLVHSRARGSSATRPSERCCHLFVPLFLSEYLVSELQLSVLQRFSTASCATLS